MKFFLLLISSALCVPHKCRLKTNVTLTSTTLSSTILEQPTSTISFSTSTSASTFTPLETQVSEPTCIPYDKLSARRVPDGWNWNCYLDGTFNVQYDMYLCSPPINSTGLTQAKMTVNGFDEGEEGGWSSYCDGKYHRNSEFIVALSTGWFNDLKNCGRIVRIYANGRYADAKVVDECDSRAGCDEEHGFLPPCNPNIVDTSSAVWDALQLDQNVGIVDVEWEFLA